MEDLEIKQEEAVFEQASANSLMKAAAGALIAAIACGIAWAVLTIQTDTEFGLAAWGIGLLCGYAAFFLSGKSGSSTIQIIAVLSSVIGILLGKYITYYYWVQDYMITFGDMFGAYDFLWVGLAVLTAWQLPARLSRG